MCKFLYSTDHVWIVYLGVHLSYALLQAPEVSSNSDGLAGMPFGGPSASDKLELARRLAQRINLQHNIGKEAKGASQQAAEFILKGGAAMQPTISAKTVAEQVLCCADHLGCYLCQ